MLLYREAGYTNYYIGTPTWQNYQPMIEHIGGSVTIYTHYNEETRSVDFGSVLNVLNSAPSKSVFLFQTCCHNPTGADFTHEQWQQIGYIMQKRQLLPLLDTAYQGFSSGTRIRMRGQFATCTIQTWSSLFANHFPKTWAYILNVVEQFTL